MTADPTRIDLHADPRVQRFNGITAHGFVAFEVPFIGEIAPNLWQGGCKTGLVLPAFIRHLVSLYPWESYDVRHEVDSTLMVRMNDSIEQDTAIVDDIARWVNARRKTGPVLVHCQAGLNRSSLVTARALMLEGMRATEVIGLLREKRSPACLCNPAFRAWLLAFDTPLGAAAARPFAADCTRVYAPHGKMAHLLPPGDLPSVDCALALCRRQPPLFGSWLGTGSQYEYERAAALPVCSRCERRAIEQDRPFPRPAETTGAER